MAYFIILERYEVYKLILKIKLQIKKNENTNSNIELTRKDKI